MNNLIFNNTSSPLFVYGDDSLQRLGASGKIYSANKTGISLLSANHTIKITSPSDKNKTLYLLKLIVTTSGISLFNINLSVIKNGTLGSGDLLTPINNNCAYSNSSIANVIYDNSTGTGSNIISDVILDTVSYTQLFNSTVCIPPNSNILIKVHSLLSLLQTLSITVYWYEI